MLSGHLSPRGGPAHQHRNLVEHFRETDAVGRPRILATTGRGFPDGRRPGGAPSPSRTPGRVSSSLTLCPGVGRGNSVDLGLTTMKGVITGSCIQGMDLGPWPRLCTCECLFSSFFLFLLFLFPSPPYHIVLVEIYFYPTPNWFPAIEEHVFHLAPKSFQAAC